MRNILNRKKHVIKAQILVFCVALTLYSCKQDNPEPLTIEAPLREIPTAALEAYKADLTNRKIAVGILYDWGLKDGSLLMHTPDSLDIIILKNGFTQLTNFQVEDLKHVQEKKKTKVLSAFELPSFMELMPSTRYVADSALARRNSIMAAWRIENPTISTTNQLYIARRDAVDLEQQAIASAEYISLAAQVVQTAIIPLKAFIASSKDQPFDGVSILLPQFPDGIFNDTLTTIMAQEFINIQHASSKKQLLIFENPQVSIQPALLHADWLIYNRQTANFSLANFTDDASLWPTNKFIPSVDLSNETDADGFSDTPYFGPNGVLPRSIDFVSWTSPNHGGIAYVHMEKDYHHLNGNLTYATVRYGITNLNK